MLTDLEQGAGFLSSREPVLLVTTDEGLINLEKSRGESLRVLDRVEVGGERPLVVSQPANVVSVPDIGTRAID